MGEAAPDDEVIIECVTFCYVYEEHKGGEQYRMKNKFRCTVAKGEKRLVELRESISLVSLLHMRW